MRSILDAFIGAVAPLACALCGDALPAVATYPLCERCAAGLPRVREPRCPRCGKGLVSEEGLCMRCRRSNYDFDSAYPLFPYAAGAKELVQAYKLVGRRSLGRYFARELEAAYRGRWDGLPIVPVPPSPGKLRKKGWDQVAAIAAELRRRGLPVRGLLRRAPGGAAQKSLDYEGRAANLRGRMILRPGLRPGTACVLLDDVMTTGATLSECARALKAGGASAVGCLVIAAD